MISRWNGFNTQHNMARNINTIKQDGDNVLTDKGSRDYLGLSGKNIGNAQVKVFHFNYYEPLQLIT